MNDDIVIGCSCRCGETALFLMFKKAVTENDVKLIKLIETKYPWMRYYYNH